MKTKYIVPLLATALVVLLFFTTAQASSPDKQIESSIKKTYVFRTYLENDDIQIQSKDGVVTLAGSVSEEAHKTLAQETVANLPGVKSVDNRLKVADESPTEYSDAWLMTKVKTSLLFHRSVSGFATGVDVKEGVVTLRGDADSQAQIDLATEYAKDIDGVTKVNNEMTVAKDRPKTEKKTIGKTMSDVGDEIDDASITALAKSSLLYHRSTSGLKTKVETNDGVVTLTGKAGSAAEKDLAAKRVSDVSGVKKVVNNMTID